MALSYLYKTTNSSIPTTITEDCFSGYHRFCLEQPYHLDYASSNLCSILGYTSDEIHDLFHDKYSLIVYEKDRARFLRYIDRLASKEQTLSLQYRMVCKDGHLILLHDTLTSRRLEDGRMYGFSVIANLSGTRSTDDSDDASEDSPDAVLEPYGFLKFTCEKYPKITHINHHMKEYLGITDETGSWYDLLKENIFFMIPFEERDMFHNYLEKALHSKNPVRLEHQLLRSNDRRISLVGWLSVLEHLDGEKEYVLLYMPPENKLPDNNIRKNSYFHALENAYSMIFEVNLANNTVECIGGRTVSLIGPLSDINMTVDSAKSFWLNHYILEEDRKMTKDFFDRITNPKDWDGSHMFQSKFRVYNRLDDRIHSLICFAVKLDEPTILVCCQDTTNIMISDKEQVALEKLYGWIDHSITLNQSAIGLLLLEKSENKYSLTFASSAICRYLGFGKDTFLRYIAGELPLGELLTAANLSYDGFRELINSRHLSFRLKAQNGSKERQTTLICNPYEFTNSILYEIWVYGSPDSKETGDAPKKIFARTFGHFDLFVDDMPVMFSSEKEKELMALLIDRNGGTLSPNEAISYLWEDAEPTSKIASRYRKLAMGLKNTLEKYGISHILLNNHGVRSINVTALECDYYELLAGNERYKNTFHNTYMTNYSWAEETLAALWDYS